MEGVQPVLLAWQLNAKQMGVLSKEEFIKWLTGLLCDTPYKIGLAMSDLEGVLFQTKPVQKTSSEVYHKTKFWPYLGNRIKTLRTLHNFIFAFGRPDGQRNLDTETAVALLNITLARRFPIAGELCAYLTDKTDSYKRLTNDVWGMIFDFCKTVKEDLTAYSEDEAWPTLLDEFVTWKKGKEQA